MLTIQDKLILKRRVHLQSGQQLTKTFKLLRCRYRTISYQIYDIYDNEINQQLTLKMLIKNQQLSKQRSINQIKNHQLFSHMPQFISLYDIYEDSSCIYLIMQKWGNTLGEVISMRQTLTQFEVQVIFSQLLDIVVEMRKKNIAHGSIRLQSVYVDVKQSHRIKLGEFNKSFNMGRYFQSLTIEESNRLSNEGQIQQISQKLLKQHQYSSILNEKQKQSLSANISVYTSPQQIKFFKQKNVNDYSKYLSTLYQNDIWAIGVVIYKLLMGRYPFEGEEENQCPSNPNQFKNSNQENKKKFVFGNFSSKNGNSNILSTLIKQCCYNFHFNDNNSFNDSPISLHFQQLIKSILKPVDKRITLKQLLAHPLKLRQLDNVRGINFNGEIPPLSQCDVTVSQSLICLKHEIFQKWNEKNKKRQDHSQEKKYQQGLKFLTPLSNFPQFSLYSDESYPFSILNQYHQQSRYSFTWELNFSNDYQELQQRQINERLKQSKNGGRNDKKIGTKNNVSNKKQLQTAQSWNKQSRDKGNIYHNGLQRNLIEKQKDVFNERSTTSKRKSRPKQNLQQASSQKNKDYINENILLSGSSSSHNFNIRNVNTSKKTLDTHVYKKPTQDRNNLETVKKQNKMSVYMPRSDDGKFQSYESNMNSSDGKVIGSTSINKKRNNGSPKSQQSNSHGYYFNRFIQTDTVNENDDRNFSQQNKKNSQQNQRNNMTQINKNENYIQAQQIIMKTYLQPIPLLVQEPQFILQYKYDKVANSLGYVLNNGVGVVYCYSGKHIMGHNQTDYVILSKNLTQNQNINTKSNYQSSVNLQNNSYVNKAYNQSTKNLLSSQQQQIYNNYLKLFGKRMVISNFSLWVVKFWQQGRIFIFFFNNGSWQVTFQGKKTSKFFIIDQNQLIWTKGKQIQKPQILNKVRQIVQEKKNLIMKEKYNF